MSSVYRTVLCFLLAHLSTVYSWVVLIGELLWSPLVCSSDIETL